jgi:hypothetical protein
MPREKRPKSESIDLLLKFIDEHDRLPRNRASKKFNVDDYERKLGQFWINWSQEYRKGITPENESIIIEEIKSKNLNIRELSRENKLSSIRDFFNKHKRRPNINSHDEDEAKLGKWLMSVNANKTSLYKNLSKEDLDLLTNITNNYSTYGEKVSKVDRITEILEFIEDNKRTPKRTDSNPREKVLAGRLNNLKIRYKKNLLSQDEKEVAKKIMKYVKNSVASIDRVKEVLEFITENNRMPSRDGNVVIDGKMKYSAHEKRMSHFLNNKYSAYKLGKLDTKLEEKRLFEQILKIKNEIKARK